MPPVSRQAQTTVGPDQQPNPNILAGRQFKRRRLNLLLSQRELAERLGVNSITISRWERGKNRISKRNWKALTQVEKELEEDDYRTKGKGQPPS